MKNFSFTKAGRAWNEDRCFSCEKFAFVLDGATSLFKQKYSQFNTDAEWLSDYWYNYLKDALCDEKKSVIDILYEGLELCNKEYLKLLSGNEVKDCPSSTLSLVRRRNGKLEIFVVADSPIILQAKTGTAIEIFDNRCDILDDINKLIIKDYAVKENISVIQARKSHPECINNGRKIKNKPFGYYVVDTSNCKEMIENAIYKEVDENLIKKVIILSDGYSQIFDLFNYYSITELSNKLNSFEDAEKIYAELCKLQDKDPAGDEFVRFKVRDDASVAVLNLDE